jgi:hypothetical protein
MTYLDDLQSPVVEHLDRAGGGASQAMIRRWLVIVLSLATILLGRELLWRVGVTVPQRTISAVLSLLLLAAVTRLWIYVRGNCLRPVLWHAFPARLGILTVWVAWLTAWGLFRGNFVSETFKEVVSFLLLILLAQLATYDEVWRGLRKPLTWFVYLGFIAILLTVRMPGIDTTWGGSTDISIDWVPRNEGTIGFFMRGMATPGLLLCAWGLVQRRTDWWRLLAIGGLIIYFTVHVMLFEFRGAVVTIAAVLFVFLLLTPIIRGSIPLGTVTLLVLVGCVTFIIVSRTYAFEHLLSRFGQGQYFRARITEAQALFTDMGPLDLLVGRGIGAWYEGPYWAPVFVYNGHRMWAATHFGILGFVLRGGFPLLLFMLTFALPIFGPKPRAWYQVDINLAAIVLAPALLLDMTLNPMILNVDNFFDFLLWSFCLARFCTPPMATETDAELLPDAPTADAYNYSY